MIWSDFYPYVLPYVIGCPNPTVDVHIRQAAIEFCRATHCDTRTLDPLTTNGVDHLYEIDFPSQTQPLKLLAVAIAGLDYPLVTLEHGQQLVREQSAADFCFTRNKRTLDVYPLRLAGESLEVEMVLAPSYNATGIDTDVASPYMSEIASGALASLFLIPKQPWSDSVQAATQFNLSRARIGVIAMHFSRGQSTAKLRSYVTYC